MSKLKTKSGVKKRFRLTGSGKVIMGQAGKRHNLRKRSMDMKRGARGTTCMKECDSRFVKRYFMPYGVS
ncbi:50S ribosomal protein L35 [Candidatus Hepatobacter penaei]|uniref:50S ribosomal protein L35 n=1 Tax=Candidatus Hepatobacter penaei TaxID=1274402 RepID=UPI0004F3D6D9|nr:50S ribosomal protein L35 [Candidatus Hepatobacter penaei]TGW15879.1 50S ribosomal protein L35 [bacterium NHP-B]